MIFPDFNFDEIETEPILSEESTKIGKSFVFDYQKGQFVMENGSPKTATELKSIEQWLELLIRTKTNEYLIYKDTGFGTSLKNYIGHTYLPHAFMESELEREINEACEKLNPAIDNVNNFETTIEKRIAKIKFQCNLKNKQVLEMETNV